MTTDEGLRELQEGGLFLDEETTAPELDARGLAALEVWAVIYDQAQSVDHVVKTKKGPGHGFTHHLRAEAVAAAVQLRAPLHPWDVFTDVLKLHRGMREGDLVVPERPAWLAELLDEDPDWILHELERLGAIPLV